MYSGDGKYIGYSVRKNAYSEFVSPSMGGQANKYMVLAVSQYDQLIYDGYNNIFLPLTLTTTHGFRKNSSVGEKTAIVMTQNGYLFAYYPGEITGIDEEDGEGIIQPGTFELAQNYPNP
ncbi:MAG: hypothetical protein GWO08_08360, partial [Gammaproteobacteria bacterium]|nr:hypothetical protein [Gammaproteobacteria bacterium]